MSRRPAGGRRISNLPALRLGDLLVFSDTKVIAARLAGRRGARAVELTPLDMLALPGYVGTNKEPLRPEVAMFFRFPEDARWNPDQNAVEFGIGVGEYAGTVRIPRRVFQSLLSESPTPERCLEGYHMHRTRFERIAERKLRRRQLTDDANVEITGRDLRSGPRDALSERAQRFGGRPI